MKVAATITNAQAYLRLQAELDGLDAYLWAFVDGAPIQNQWTLMGGGNPAQTPLSGRISKDLSKRGFKFLVSTIIYTYMQAIDMVNDHCVECFRHRASRD